MAESFSRSGISMTWDPMPNIMADQFDKLGVNVKSFKVPLDRSIRQVMSPSIAKNFASGGRPTWQPLTNTTLILRKSRGIGGSQVLVATGKLSKTAAQFNIWSVDGPAGTATLDNLPASVKYGMYHQTGWQPGAGALAEALYVDARPWAVIQPEDANEIEEIFFTWIEERIDADISAGRRSGF